MPKKNKNVSSKNALSTLKKYLHPFRIQIVVGVILAFISTALRICAPLMVKQISQCILNGYVDGTYNTDFSKVTIFGLICIGLYVAAFITDYILCFMMATLTSDVAKNMRKDMSKKINLLPLRYFDNRNIGDVLSIVSNDIDTIGTTLNSTLSSFITSVMTMIGVIAILFMLNWFLALIVVIALPIELIILLLVAKKSQKYFVGQQNYLAIANSQAEENYTASMIVKVFRASDDAIASFSKTNENLANANKNSQFFSRMMLPLMTLLGNIVVSAICLFGGTIAFRIQGLVDAGTMDKAALSAAITTIVTCMTYSYQMMQPLSQIAQLGASFQQTLAAASRVYDFLNADNEEDETSKTKTIDVVKGNISFSHVKFGYDSSRVIIHDFTENAKQGQKVAIVGPTGAGKTTMVNLLMRFYDIDGGSISIEQIPSKEMNRSYVRSLFGMVLQDTWLFEGSFMENLKFGRRNATDEEVYEACKATHCDSFIKLQPQGYNTILSEECGLSAGQKQLVTIARAMVQNAPMLILDEATSSVDTRTELLIQDAMDKLTKGRTSFVIAHRLSTIKNSDLILVMRDGDVIESGTHDSLMAKHGFYSELYNAQFSGKGPQID